MDLRVARAGVDRLRLGLLVPRSEAVERIDVARAFDLEGLAGAFGLDPLR
jgi:hypothetical protein